MNKPIFDNIRQAEIEYERLERKYLRVCRALQYWFKIWTTIRNRPSTPSWIK